MKSKYPGSIIKFEVGSVSDLAGAYGVSERTIYRWLSKADKEERGIKYPGAKALEREKGTRKQIAAKYGVSERTVYRWIRKAKTMGANIPPKSKPNKYPGQGILEEKVSASDLAKKYNVSKRTIFRWKAKARAEKLRYTISPIIPEPEEIQDEEIIEVIDHIEPEDARSEFIEEPEPIEPIEFEDKEPEDYGTDLPKDSVQNLKDMNDILLSDPELIPDNSIFRDLTLTEQIQYLDFYIQYQFDLDEHQFYNPETHELDTSAEFVSNLNIWGSEFETWTQRQFESSMYEV